MQEKYQRLIAELIQLNSVAKQDYADMQPSDKHHFETADYSDGYGDGYEEAKEYFCNIIDELSKILRNLEIEDTMEKQVKVSENQMELL